VSLDALVVTATGQQQKRELANAVSQINADEIVETAAVNSVSQLLTGRAAGVTVLQTGGTSGTGSRIRIRGSTSVSLSNEPIIFVDGIRIVNPANGFSVGVGGQETSGLNDINPENIESIEIIKGPSAATLYGTDAANGVIIIKTKRGGESAPRLNSWIEVGSIQEVSDFPENTRLISRATGQRTFLFRQPNRQAARADSLLAFTPLEDPVVSPFDDGLRQQYGASVAGGTGGINYYVSGEWESDNGVLALPDTFRNELVGQGIELTEAQERPNAVERIHLRANLGAQLAKNLSLSVATGYTTGETRLPQNDNNVLGLLPSGLLGSPLRENNLGFGFFRPDEIFAIEAVQDISRFTGSAQANWVPMPWLNARAALGLDVNDRFDSEFTPVGRVAFGDLLQGARTSNRARLMGLTADVGATANFSVTPDISSRSSVGVQYFRDEAEFTLASGEILVPGSRSLNAAARSESSESFAETVTLGTFFEQQFGWKDRYFITGAVRGDDNSAFGQEFDFIVYPKLGASAVVIDETQEPWFNVVNSLRLRAAWGAAGRAPGVTDALQFFEPVAAVTDGEDVGAVTFGELGNEFLEPERSSEVEAGFDLGVLDGRLSFEFTYFDKNTEDALVSTPLAPSLGVSPSRFLNLGEVSNQGFEGAINAILLNMRNARWELNFTGTRVENELVDLGQDQFGEDIPEVVFAGVQRFREGFPLGAFFDRPLTFEDRDDNGIITRGELTVGDTAVFLGSPFPETELSIHSQLKLFNLVQLRGLLDFRGDFVQFNNTELFRARFGIARGLNDPEASLFEQARAANALLLGGGRTSAPFIEDASFWKLRELSATLFVPERWSQRLGSSNMSISFMGRNLATWTDFTGLDPEVSQTGPSNFATRDFLTQPPVRTYSVRLNLGF
jgi:TonB-linked SusC/RagA family outer membrane protein